LNISSEPNVELLSPEDVHKVVLLLTAALERRRAEQRFYKVLEKPVVKKLLIN
jgi:hypothetical protein